MHAAAPDGTGIFSLGQAYSSRMVPLGVVVFANDEAHQHRADVNRFQHESLSVEDQRSLAANASAWHVATAELGAETSERYAVHRAFQITHTVEVDASTMTADPPAGAVYYLARIAYGHLYEEVVHGSNSAFHAGLSVSSHGGISRYRGVGRCPACDRRPATRETLPARTEVSK